MFIVRQYDGHGTDVSEVFATYAAALEEVKLRVGRADVRVWIEEHFGDVTEMTE